MNETRDLYYLLKNDRAYYNNEAVDFTYLELKEKVKSYRQCNNQNLIKSINDLIDKEKEGLFYKGFEICFKLNNDLFYISHHHKSNEFIKNVIEILKYNCATDIFIKYGELD